MSIDWPESDQTPDIRPARPPAVGRGELGLLPNDWAARDRSRRIRARDAIAVLLVIAVMLVIGAALYIYGPLPSIFPANCPGCIVNRP